MKPAISKQQDKFTNNSPLTAYRELVCASGTIFTWLYYEVCICLFANLGGLLGFAFRKIFYPCLFQACGKRVAFGRSGLIRNAKKISIGSKVLLDDFFLLDARRESEIELEDYVSIGRYTLLVAKTGSIKLKKGCNIGSHCRIATQSKVEIGESTLIAAYCYIGPGNHQSTDGKAMIEEDMDIKGGVIIGPNVWIGAHSTIMDGVTIGADAIVGAHSFVKDDVPAGATVVGVPAKIVTKIKS